MDEGQQTDVNTEVEEQTTDTSSGVEQTAVDTEQEETQSTAASQSVPYERFKEVNDVLKEVKQELAELKTGFASNQTSLTPQVPVDPAVKAQEDMIKQQFKKVADELGYVSQDHLRQKERDQILEQTLTTLEKELDGKDGRPKFNRDAVIKHALENNIGDPMKAYKDLNESGLINWHVEQALKGKGVSLQTETSNGSGSQAANGASMDDLKARAAKGDQEAIDTLLARHARAFGV